MSLAATLLLAAAAAAQTPQDGARNEPDRGAQVETARVSVTILRPAVVKGGSLILDPGNVTPHSQRQSREGRVTYEFE